MQGQYAQIGQRPRHPGTLVDYKRNFRADLVGVSEREIREQWQQLLDEYEKSREPSKDARFYTDDGTPIVLVDDNVNPRTLTTSNVTSPRAPIIDHPPSVFRAPTLGHTWSPRVMLGLYKIH